MLNKAKSIIKPRIKQKEAVEYIVDNFVKFPLIEAPTGFGKTIVLLLSAIELQKRGKTVIISTPNNKLTIDAYREAISYYPDLLIDFQIGARNYIDENKLQACIEDEILEKYVLLESLKEWEIFAKNKKKPLYDDFSEIVTFTDIAYKDLVQELVCKTSNKEEELFKQDYITFTNHFFLLSAMRSVRDEEKLKTMVVLVDEVHELSSVAEVIFQNNFSPFFLKSTIRTLIQELKKSKETFTGKKSLTKDLSLAYSIISSEFSNLMKIANSSKVGEFDSSHREFYMRSVGAMYCEATKSLQARLIKTIKKQSLPLSSKGIITAIFNEINELKGVNGSLESNNDVNIFLSPSKGYPTYKSSKGIIPFLINSFLWKRISGGAGLSATLNTTIRITENTNKKFAYSRVGLNHKIAPEIKTFKREFPKENVKLITKPIQLYSFDYDSKELGADSDIIRWSNEIALHVVNTYNNKKSMLLVGSFKEAEYLQLAFENLQIENVITASKNLKTAQVIKDFIKRGSILIGTKNFGIGLSLNGDLLERLYITKLPYPQTETTKWVQLKEYNMSLFWTNFNNEMIMQLRQFFGRLQRTKNDKGEIHLLDARGIKSQERKFSQSIVSKVNHYMSEYGIFDEEKSVKIIDPSAKRYEVGSVDDEDLF